MKAIEYRTIDKSDWARGEWDNEPDKMQFADEVTGLPCLVVRGSSGGLCGYVGVAENHPLFGKGYDEADIDVHGGLTFADKCRPHESGEQRGICHIPSEGEPDHVWWFGFDCAHAWDFTPAYSGRPEAWFRQCHDETYRDIGYVKSEIRGLARQLAAAQAQR
ncbi:MAG: hypothetical protein WKF61_00645 [Luteimonas sp.]